MPFDELKARAERTPYHEALGVRVESIAADRVRLRIPFKDENSNPGRALHGGVSASAIDIGGALAAWTAVEERPGLEAATLDLTVNYLAAAIGEDIVANAEVLRRGKEIVYSEVDVRTDAGKRIAIGLVTYRVFDRAASPAAAQRQRITPSSDPARSGERIQGAGAFVMSPFISRLGLSVEHAHDGETTLTMPFRREHADVSGAVHEGALAALIDTTGALASWSITGLDMRFKASTVGIHANYHTPAVEEAVVAHARTLRRNNEMFLNQVTVSGCTSGALVATGSVTYRIVIGG